MKRIPRPSAGVVIGLLALCVAIGGTAIAGGGKKPKTGTIVGYAQVKANGDVRTTKSLNVTNANVDVFLDDPSTYCFKNLPFNYKGAQVTMDDYSVKHPVDIAASFAKSGFRCEAGYNASVLTSGGGGDFPLGFYVVFYK
jgi:hypothetical protein